MARFKNVLLGKAFLYFFAFAVFSCTSSNTLNITGRNSLAITGSEFYKQASSFSWQKRDSFVISEILGGNVPAFFRKFTAIHTQINDSIGNIIRAVYYVSRDYLSIGNDTDWARVSIPPMTAQKIADSFFCFLPTKKMVDDIYKEAEIKLQLCL